MAVRRIVLRVVATLAAAAVAVAGFLLVHGDFQRWKDESALDGACDGLLDRDVVRDVLGPGAVDVENTERADLGLVRCEVEIDGGGSADIRVLDTAHVGEDRMDSLYTGSPGEKALSVPVGQGWTGLFGARPKHVGGPFDTDEAEDVTVSLVLGCAGAGRTEGLSVTVETTLDKTLDDPANRPEFARIATSTAAKASKARRCGARLGQRVRSLGLPVDETEYRPLGTADGTCSGINAGQGVSVATGDRARGSAVRSVSTGGPGPRCALRPGGQVRPLHAGGVRRQPGVRRGARAVPRHSRARSPTRRPDRLDDGQVL